MPARGAGRWVGAAVLVPWLGCGVAALAAQPAAPPATSPALRAPDAAASAPLNSALDAPLFYQLLIGELELRGGESGTAYAVILDAARRTRDEALFRRAVDIALAARAGEQALAAARAWRQARPESLDALRTQVQILVAMRRGDEIAEPVRALLAQLPAAERPAAIAVLPRLLQRVGDARTVAVLVEQLVRPYAESTDTRVAARVAQGRAWLAAEDGARALALAREAQAMDPADTAPALLALELLRTQPQAEALVTQQLAQADAPVALRLSYVRALTDMQRYAEALSQLTAVTRQQPELAGPYLTLGALHLELRNTREGEAALLRYLELAGTTPPAVAPPTSPHGGGDDDDAGAGASEPGVVRARLMLAQAAEQRGDFAAAEKWLAQIDDPRSALDVQTRRASMLARQGRVGEARELIQKTPERGREDQRAKLVAELGVLREVKRWRDAYEVLAGALERFPEDSDLMYEQAMMAEKLDRIDEMERLLRRVIELKPNSAHAHNALGYSLADRSLRLGEARDLIQRALQLAPGDPFITDSLGWVEFRLGNREEALRLLQTAFRARPDPEIGAHLGEVLWSLDRRDEARQVWREARDKDAANEVLRETLARLRVEL